MPSFSLVSPNLKRLQKSSIAAVLTSVCADLARPLAKALLAGGIDTIKLTLPTPVALDAFNRILAEWHKMLAGVDTILTLGQVWQAHAAGAGFGVSPGLNAKLVKAASEHGCLDCLFGWRSPL
ncbi:MAG: keto-deoxy-phosphogluconate aldolase, partial [Verrucomicrobiia bacterium]